jgi:hypothetical protein
MAKKFHILLITLILSFFATPTLTYACGTKTNKTEKSCCKKDKSDNTVNTDCCKNHKTKNDKNDDGCVEKCKHPSCSCPVVNFAFNLPFSTGFKTKTCFSEGKKVKSYYNETFLSSGFYSIWTPPNIG